MGLNNLDIYIKTIKENLTEARYEHSILVAAKARELAGKFGADETKAEIAGLLHDVCKDLNHEKLLQTMGDFGIILDSTEKRESKLWHAIAGAAFAKNVLKVTDTDILNAIRYHTTARANMSVLEKVLYLADFISDDRKYDGVDEMRSAVEISMEFAMIYSLKFTIKDLCDRERAVHPDTVNAYNEVILGGAN